MGWVGLALAAAAACGDESGDSEEVRASRERWCGGVCAASAACGQGLIAGCAERCAETPTGLFARMTPSALSAQGDCFARTSSCADGFEALVESCVEAAWEDFPPTQASATTCEAMAAPLFECDWFSSFEQCASFLGVFTEPALEAWQTCSDVVDCDALDQCAELTLFTYGD